MAWTAPIIIDSIASPAAAASPGKPFPCSYASIVFTINGTGPFAVKINPDPPGPACEDTNSTSNDLTGFSSTCGADIFSNRCSGDLICKNAVVVPAYTGPCPFTVSGGHVTAAAGVIIQFAIVHDGGCDPTTHFCPPFCGPITSFDANCGK